MVKPNIEKKTAMWFGLLVVLLSVIYIFVTLGKTDWVRWIAVVWGFFLTGLLLIEAGVVTYFKNKDWRKFSMGDMVVIGSVVFATVIGINTLLLIGNLKQTSPLWLVNFTSTTGVISGIGGAILGIIHIFYPRFK